MTKRKNNSCPLNGVDFVPKKPRYHEIGKVEFTNNAKMAERSEAKTA